MKRWTVRISMLFGLGIVTTVAVAWGLALVFDINATQPATAPTLSTYTDTDGIEYREWQHVSTWRTAGTTYHSVLGTRENAQTKFGNRTDDVIALDDALPSWAAPRTLTWTPNPNGGPIVQAGRTFSASGWPLPAVVARTERVGHSPGPQYPIPIYEIHHGLRAGDLTDDIPRALPLRPILPGFIINTLFYAAVWLVLLLGWRAHRRLIRKWQGHCPMCNYDLRGDLAKGCSECGWGREES